MQGIYKIENLINHKVYIGKSTNTQRRWKDHKRLAITDGHKEYNKALYQAMRKYGVDNFQFTIIEELADYSNSNDRERYWISHYDSYNNGYNESLGGDGGSLKSQLIGSANGRSKLTEEDIILIRTYYQLGKSRSECYKIFSNKISPSGFGRVWTGQTWQHIMPEVFTSQNKIRNASLGKSQGAKQSRIYTNEEITAIRISKKDGISLNDAFKKFGKGSINTFRDIWYNRTYKEIQV